MPQAGKKLELVSNVVFIVVALLLGAFVVRNQMRPDPSEEGAKLLLGKTVQIPTLDFQGSPKTILLILSSRCGYCKDSLPFYRTITEKRKGKNIRVVAVFPGELEEAKRFLSDQGVAVDQIVQASFQDLSVPATPTIALADEHGTILRAWVGLLPDDKQKSVLRKMSL
jgi:thioredoxin-related protein